MTKEFFLFIRKFDVIMMTFVPDILADFFSNYCFDRLNDLDQNECR